MAKQFNASEATDRQLVERFGDVSDQAAFAEIVRRYGPMALATAKRILGREQDAEDACQATFFALAKLPDKLRTSDRIGGWLHEAVRRTSLSIRRSQIRDGRKMEHAREQFQETEERTDTDPTKRVANDELAIILDDELSKLPADFKTAIVLCDLEGVSQRQAAKQLGLPPTTVGNHIKKGRKLLCQRLVGRGITLTSVGLVGGIAAIRGSTALGDKFVNQTTNKAMLFAAGHDAAELGVSSTVIEMAVRLTTSMKTSKVVSLCLVAVVLVLLSGFIAERVGIRSVKQTLAQELRIVVPSDWEDIDADGRVSSAPSYRYQQIFHKDEFSSLEGGRQITQWSMRPDVETPAGHEVFWAEMEIRLSVTSVAPDEMSTVFEDNITGPETVVYQGPWTSVTQSTGPAGGAKDFDVHINLTEPFEYDPREGHLLHDLRTSGGESGVDQLLVRSPAGASMFTGPNAIDAEISTGAFFGVTPTRITFVPEPSSMGLAALGLTGIHACLRRRSLFAHA